MHSKYSDGTNTVIELLQEAEAKKLKIISITDHETCEGHREIRNIDISKYYSGNIIRGVEVKAFYNGRVVDILGYNIDIDKMDNWLQEFYKNKSFESVQNKYLDHYYKVCEKLNLMITPKEELDYNLKKEWASVLIHKELTKYPENRDKLPEDLLNNFDIFRHKHCYNPDSLFYIDKSEDFPKLTDCIKAIKDAGGISFLAHAYIYKWATDKAAFINDIIDNYGIDGIELEELEKEITCECKSLSISKCLCLVNEVKALRDLVNLLANR
jgi:predicted metal-dependent phosphoesterase TrpH